MNDKTYYVYIPASKRNGTLYTGVTNDIIRRVYEHKEKIITHEFIRGKYIEKIFKPFKRFIVSIFH